jgi:hypothetical protein
VRAPSDGATRGERRGEHLAGQAAGLHHHTRVELDVGEQRTTGFELGQGADHGGLDRERGLGPLAAELLRDPAQQDRPRVVGGVDAVAEAHDPIARRHRVAHPPLGIAGPVDLVQHVERPARCAAVQRSRQRPDGTADGAGQVGAGRGDDPGGEGRGVEAVVHGQDQVLLQCTHLRGRGLRAGDHPEQVRDVSQIGTGREGSFAVAQPMCRRDDGRHHRAQTQGLVDQLVAVDVQGRPPAGGGPQGGHARPQHLERRPLRSRARVSSKPGGNDRNAVTRSPNSAAPVASGSSSWAIRYHTSSKVRRSARSTAEYWR